MISACNPSTVKSRRPVDATQLSPISLAVAKFDRVRDGLQLLERLGLVRTPGPFTHRDLSLSNRFKVVDQDSLRHRWM